MEGHVKVGRVHHPPYLAMDGFQKFLLRLGHEDGLGHLVEDGEIGQPFAQFTEEAGVLQGHGHLAGDGGKEGQVLLVVEVFLLITLDGHYPHHPVGSKERHTQPGEGLFAQLGDILLLLESQVLLQVAQKERLAVADDIAGQAGPYLVGGRRKSLPPLDLKSQGPFVGALLVGGDVKVGGVEEAPDLLMDDLQELVQFQGGGNGPANLVEDGEFGDAPFALLEETGVFDGHRSQVGDVAQEVQVAAVVGSRAVGALHGDHADDPIPGEHRHAQIRPGRPAHCPDAQFGQFSFQVFPQEDRPAGLNDMHRQPTVAQV